ncbi:MAG: adenosylcobinamide-GDP ribazoletransferase [Bacteroidota bacterium]
MREELKIFFAAVMFYTRIPCPSWVDHRPEYINKSIRYFPLIGWIIGILSGVGLVVGNWLISPFFAAIFCIVISVWLTGAFHEDGFADVCDGFGGGWTKEQILRIMKDSRVGTYAVVGLILLLTLKVALLTEIIRQQEWIYIILVVVNGHTLSRLMAATVIFTHQYVREDEQSKARPFAKAYSKINIILALLFGLIPTAVIVTLTNQLGWCLVPMLLYLVKVYLSNLFQRKIGGYTGDCLGATQQIVEVAYYIMVVLLWKFI